MEGVPNTKEIKDLGYFTWSLLKTNQEKNAEKPIKWEDLMERLNINLTPPLLKSIEELNNILSREETLVTFKDLFHWISDKTGNQEELITLPPAISCYIAKKRGCSMKNVDFLIRNLINF